MKFVTVIFSLVMITFPPSILAHEGHGHLPVTMKKAAELALSTVAAYTQVQPPFGIERLNETWRNLPRSAATIYENGRGFYIVKVENLQARQSIYVRILLDGTIDNANLSGNFSPAKDENNDSKPESSADLEAKKSK